MITDNDKINSSELGIFIFLAVVGMGVLSLPSRLNSHVNNDAWLVIIVAALINILFLYIICKVGKINQNRGFVETLRFLFGNILGTILAIPVIIYCILFMGLELRLFGEVTKLYLLHKTPLEFIIFPLIILVTILVRKGIEAIAHSFGILVFIIGFAVLALTLAGSQNMQMSNLRPFFTQPLSNYISGLMVGVYAFSGVEIMLIMYPYIKKPQRAFKAATSAIVAVLVLYIVITVQCITSLGNEETKSLVWPVMALTKSISIPGGFVEDVEGLLAALWVIYAFTSLVSFMFFYTVIAGDVFKHKKNKHFASLSIPVLYIISLQGSSIADVFKLIDFVMRYFSSYTTFVLPVIMLIFSLIKGKRMQG